jgi:diadenosine tetraphosphate (Ap4A) HIT family hydrolase
MNHNTETDQRPCPFCQQEPPSQFYEGSLVRGLWDACPASPGHALLVPKRHVSSWFDATADEQAELLSSLAIARQAVEATHRPDGYNIGINVGAAADQSVFHLHIHLIPRYAGDSPDPRGGVRHAVHGKGSYQAPQER